MCWFVRAGIEKDRRLQVFEPGQNTEYILVVLFKEMFEMKLCLNQERLTPEWKYGRIVPLNFFTVISKHCYFWQCLFTLLY